MALIDSRLLPLIDLLAGAGADWLAFELMDYIRAGRPAEDPPEVLAQSRMQVREGRGEGPLEPPEIVATSATSPIVGDEQILWAARYVADRLDMSRTDSMAF
jgi:hypothetical protein